jgi:AAA domain
MTAPVRTFTDSPAVRERVPVLLGLVAPSGGGKTYSMLRLLTGLQRENGGEIFVIDTEGRRALQYADLFKFRHVPFEAPFSPLDYLAVIKHCVSKGAKNIGIDSMSHEHEGAGGVLEMHERELDRMTARIADEDLREKKRDASNWRAWARPKAERRQLLNAIIQLGANMVFCFRAKEKSKQVKNPQTGKQELVDLGWQAIAGEEFVFEMMALLLLQPGSGGVPDLKPEMAGERALVKVPGFLAPMLAAGKPLDEDLGQKLAHWAAGDAKQPLSAAATGDTNSETIVKIGGLLGQLPNQDAKKAAIVAAFAVRTWKEVQALPREKLEHGLALLQRARQESDDQAEAHRQAMAQNEEAAGQPRGISPQEPPSEEAAQGRLL